MLDSAISELIDFSIFMLSKIIQSLTVTLSPIVTLFHKIEFIIFEFSPILQLLPNMQFPVTAESV